MDTVLPVENITANGDGPMGPEPSASGSAELARLFERARQALATRLQLDPEITEALASPRPGWSDALPGQAAIRAQKTSGHLAAQLAVDTRTRHVIVRVIDTRTGEAVREVPSDAMAGLAAKIGRVIACGTQR